MEGDVTAATELLKDIREKCKDATSLVQGLCKKAENGEFSTSAGISFLEVKYQLLLSYLTNLTYTMYQKCRGASIQDDTAIHRLVEIRTVLEKMRPIDQKLKYQIDKVVRIATTGGTDSSDPMRFHANPDNLESKLDSEGSDSDSDKGTDGRSEERKKAKIYRPPKLAAVHYDGDETVTDKRQRQLDNLKKRALNSDVMRDLKEQYSDGPEEIQESRDMHRVREDKKTKDRQRYEEDHFVRLSVSKRDKQSSKQLATMSSLGSLTQFDSISALDMDGDDDDFPAKRRKLGKGKTKGGKGKKGFKKKRRH